MTTCEKCGKGHEELFLFTDGDSSSKICQACYSYEIQYLGEEVDTEDMMALEIPFFTVFGRDSYPRRRDESKDA